jgi:hypothetical protein
LIKLKDCRGHLILLEDKTKQNQNWIRKKNIERLIVEKIDLEEKEANGRLLLLCALKERI